MQVEQMAAAGQGSCGTPGADTTGAVQTFFLRSVHTI